MTAEIPAAAAAAAETRVWPGPSILVGIRNTPEVEHFAECNTCGWDEGATSRWGVWESVDRHKAGECELRWIRAELIETRAALDRVTRLLVDLANGKHASSGRDFGRGVAYVSQLVGEAVAGDKLSDLGSSVSGARLK